MSLAYLGRAEVFALGICVGIIIVITLNGIAPKRNDKRGRVS